MKDDEDKKRLNEALAIFKPYTRFSHVASSSYLCSFLPTTNDEDSNHVGIPPLPRPYGSISDATTVQRQYQCKTEPNGSEYI